MTVDIDAFLHDCRRAVDNRLKARLAKQEDNRLSQAMNYSLFNGGKRIRPSLCYAAAEVFAPVNDQVHRAAMAVELIHAYSLIHDDLPAMDDDDLRRGKPTCHIAFDEATAILAGDALQTLAFEVLSESFQNADTQLQLLRLLSRASGAMVLGQSLDLYAVNTRQTLEQLETMHNHKTGALIRASILMGAIASQRANQEQLSALEAYSLAIGLAFQVKDDILDEESSTQTLGKRQGADKALNKPTYTSLLGLEGAKAKLAELHTSANQALKIFADKGRHLKAIADFIVARNH
ncbi:MAG: polyprenyl synthetase family protein [Porticoccaceae bacterium]|nr:polyprenyl synthetase family protein [Porticoccaceae bacterium]